MPGKTIRLKETTWTRLQAYAFGFESPDDVISKLLDGEARPYRECEYYKCQKRFLPKDARQRYCPNPVEGRESKCGQNDRQKKFREGVAAHAG